MGAATLGFLLFAGGQLPNNTDLMNRREFLIPLNIDADRQREIREMVLYVSTDRGKTWRQHMRVAPTKQGFVFRANSDGEFWFKAAAVNLAGKQIPDERSFYQKPPDRKVIIDSQKPFVQITNAERHGEYISVRWRIEEQHPDLGSIRVKHRPAGTLLWEQTNIPSAQLAGNARIRANNPNPLTIRVEMKDRAGNYSAADKEMPGSLTTASFQGDPNKTLRTNNPNGRLPLPPDKGDTKVLPVPPSGIKVANSNAFSNPSPNARNDFAKSDTRMQQPLPNPPNGGSTNSVTSWDSSGNKHVRRAPNQATIVGQSTAYKKPISSGMNLPPKRSLPQIKFVNYTGVVVTYELTNFRPGRIGAVELWLTEDNGRHWKLWMEDEAAKPFMKPAQRRTVELPGEGVFGLALVVKNSVLRGKTPKDGDVPEMRIEVDMTPPMAWLYKPEADRRQNETLILSWNAQDRNLAADPVTLEWAKSAEGPWNPIAAGLPNTGKFAWKLPQTLPIAVFLRLRVRDRAGNEAVAVSQEPQPVDLTLPEGRLTGIVPPETRH